MRPPKFLSTISVFLIVTFLTTSLSSGMPAYAAPAPVSSADSLSAKRSLDDLSQIKIPAKVGKITDFSQERKLAGSQTVILIQDAHSIPEAQRNIQRLIEHFGKEYGVRKVGLEGASDKLDTEIFRSFPDKERLKQVFEEYHERGELPGAVAAAIFNAVMSSGGSNDLVFHGLEDWRLYEKGLSLYLQAAGEETEILKGIEKQNAALEEKKKAVYSEMLLEVDQALTKFQEDQTGLAEVLKKLASVSMPAKDSAVAMLLEEVKSEKGYWGKDEQKREHKFSEMSGRFEREFEAYSKQVKESLLKNENERAIDRQSRELYLLKKLAKLELTEEEWEETKKSQAPSTKSQEKIEFLGPWRSVLGAHLAFYETAQKRDEAFFANLQKMSGGGNAMVVAGGFHSQGLIRNLKEAGINYVLVMPHLNEVPGKTHYREQMEGKFSWSSYFKEKNGRVNLFDAFVRATRDKLLPAGDAILLKNWRDEIIRNKAKAGEIETVSRYTKYLDEMKSSSNGLMGDLHNDFHSKWMANIQRFVAGMRKLDQSSQLNQANVLKLFRPSTNVPLSVGSFQPGATVSAAQVGLGKNQPSLNPALASNRETRLEREGMVTRSTSLIDRTSTSSTDNLSLISEISSRIGTTTSATTLNSLRKSSINAATSLAVYLSSIKNFLVDLLTGKGSIGRQAPNVNIYLNKKINGISATRSEARERDFYSMRYWAKVAGLGILFFAISERIPQRDSQLEQTRRSIQQSADDLHGIRWWNRHLGFVFQKSEKEVIERQQNQAKYLIELFLTEELLIPSEEIESTFVGNAWNLVTQELDAEVFVNLKDTTHAIFHVNLTKGTFQILEVRLPAGGSHFGERIKSRSEVRQELRKIAAPKSLDFGRSETRVKNDFNYHLARLEAESLKIRLRALEAIIDYLSDKPFLESYPAKEHLLQTLKTKFQNEQKSRRFKARLFKAIIYAGYNRPDIQVFVKETLLTAFSEKKYFLVEEGLNTVYYWILARRDQPANSPLFDPVRDLVRQGVLLPILQERSKRLRVAVLELTNRMMGRSSTAREEAVSAYQILSPPDWPAEFVKTVEHLEQRSKFNFVRFQAAIFLESLGLLDAGKRRKQNQDDLENFIADLLSKPAQAEGRLSPAQKTQLLEQIEKAPARDGYLLELFRDQRKKTVFVGFKLHPQEKFLALMNDIAKAQEEGAAITHFAFPMPPEAEKDFEAFLAGENPEPVLKAIERSLAFDRADKRFPDAVEIYRKAFLYLQSMGIQRVFFEIDEHLSGLKGENLLEARRNVIYSAAKEPQARILVYRDEEVITSSTARIELQAGKDTVIPSLMLSLAERLPEESISTLLLQSASDWESDLHHNLSEVLDRIPRGFGMPLAGTELEKVPFSSDYKEGMGQAFDGILFYKDDSGDDGNFSFDPTKGNPKADQPEMPSPSEKELLTARSEVRSAAEEIAVGEAAPDQLAAILSQEIAEKKSQDVQNQKTYWEQRKGKVPTKIISEVLINLGTGRKDGQIAYAVSPARLMPVWQDSRLASSPMSHMLLYKEAKIKGNEFQDVRDGVRIVLSFAPESGKPVNVLIAPLFESVISGFKENFLVMTEILYKSFRQSYDEKTVDSIVIRGGHWAKEVYALLESRRADSLDLGFIIKELIPSLKVPAQQMPADAADETKENSRLWDLLEDLRGKFLEAKQALQDEGMRSAYLKRPALEKMIQEIGDRLPSFSTKVFENSFAELQKEISAFYDEMDGNVVFRTFLGFNSFLLFIYFAIPSYASAVTAFFETLFSAASGLSIIISIWLANAAVLKLVNIILTKRTTSDPESRSEKRISTIQQFRWKYLQDRRNDLPDASILRAMHERIDAGEFDDPKLMPHMKKLFREYFKTYLPEGGPYLFQYEEEVVTLNDIMPGYDVVIQPAARPLFNQPAFFLRITTPEHPEEVVIAPSIEDTLALLSLIKEPAAAVTKREQGPWLLGVAVMGIVVSIGITLFSFFGESDPFEFLLGFFGIAVGGSLLAGFKLILNSSNRHPFGKDVREALDRLLEKYPDYSSPAMAMQPRSEMRPDANASGQQNRFRAGRSEMRAAKEIKPEPFDAEKVLKQNTDAGSAGTHNRDFYRTHTRPRINEDIKDGRYVLLRLKDNEFQAEQGKLASSLDRDLLQRILAVNESKMMKSFLEKNKEVISNVKIYLLEPEEGTRAAMHRHLLTAVGRDFEVAFSRSNRGSEQAVYLTRSSFTYLDTRLLIDILANQITLAAARNQLWHAKRPFPFGVFTAKTDALLQRIRKNAILKREIQQTHQYDLKIHNTYQLDKHYEAVVVLKSRLEKMAIEMPDFAPAKTLAKYAGSFLEAVLKDDLDAAVKEWGLLTYEMKDLELRAQEDESSLIAKFMSLPGMDVIKHYAPSLNQTFKQYIFDHGISNQDGEEYGKTVGKVIVVDDVKKVGETFERYGYDRKEPVIWVLPYLPDRYDQIPGEGIIISVAVNRHATDTAKEQSIPLAIIPNAVELLKAYDGELGMLRVNEDRTVRFRLAHSGEEGIPRQKEEMTIKAPKARTDGPSIYRLADIDENFVPFVGPKAASLGKMMSAGISVPNGFVISFNFWDRFAKYNALTPKIAALWQKIEIKEGRVHNSDEQLEDILNEIRTIILNSEFPPDLTAELKKAIEDLRGGNLFGEINLDLLQRYIKLVFASKYKQQPVRLRIRNNTPDEAVLPAVILQVPKEARYAGTMYTADPTSKDRNWIAVMASHGQGAAVVGEDGYPAEARINKISDEVDPRRRDSRIDQKYEMVHKNFFYVRSSFNFEDLIEFRTAGFYESYPDKSEKAGGAAPIRGITVSPAERETAILTDELMTKLKEQGEKIEALYDYRPQDIEWVLDRNGEFWFVQSRPMKMDKLPAEYRFDGEILDQLGEADIAALQFMKATANAGNISALLPYLQKDTAFMTMSPEAHIRRVIAAHYLAPLGSQKKAVQSLILQQVKEIIDFISKDNNWWDPSVAAPLLAFLRQAGQSSENPDVKQLIRTFFVESEVLSRAGMTHLLEFEIARARVAFEKYDLAMKKLKFQPGYPDIADRTIRILETIPLDYSLRLLESYAMTSEKTPAWMNEYALRIIDRLSAGRSEVRTKPWSALRMSRTIKRQLDYFRRTKKGQDAAQAAWDLFLWQTFRYLVWPEEKVAPRWMHRWTEGIPKYSAKQLREIGQELKLYWEEKRWNFSKFRRGILTLNDSFSKPEYREGEERQVYLAGGEFEKNDLRYFDPKALKRIEFYQARMDMVDLIELLNKNHWLLSNGKGLDKWALKFKATGWPDYELLYKADEKQLEEFKKILGRDSEKGAEGIINARIREGKLAELEANNEKEALRLLSLARRLGIRLDRRNHRSEMRSVDKIKPLKVLLADKPASDKTVEQIQALIGAFSTEAQLLDAAMIGIGKEEDKLRALIETEKPEVVLVRSDTKAFKKADFVKWAKEQGVRAIIRMGAGVDNVDTKAAKEAGISVIRTHGNANSVANVAVRFLLAALETSARPKDEKDLSEDPNWKPVLNISSEGLRKALEKVKADRGSMIPEQEWILSPVSAVRGQELFSQLQGKTIGLVGFGPVAQALAKKLDQIRKLTGVSFTMMATSPALDRGEEARTLAAKQWGVLYPGEAAVLAGSDILSLHLDQPYFDSNKLQAAAQLKVLINTARQKVIDPKIWPEFFARSGSLYFADVDLAEKGKPIEDLQKLLAAYPAQFYATPHIAASTKDAAEGVEANTLPTLKATLELLLGRTPETMPDIVNSVIPIRSEVRPDANASGQRNHFRARRSEVRMKTQEQISTGLTNGAEPLANLQYRRHELSEGRSLVLQGEPGSDDEKATFYFKPAAGFFVSKGEKVQGEWHRWIEINLNTREVRNLRTFWAAKKQLYKEEFPHRNLDEDYFVQIQAAVLAISELESQLRPEAEPSLSAVKKLIGNVFRAVPRPDTVSLYFESGKEIVIRVVQDEPASRVYLIFPFSEDAAKQDPHQFVLRIDPKNRKNPVSINMYVTHVEEGILKKGISAFSEPGHEVRADSSFVFEDDEIQDGYEVRMDDLRWALADWYESLPADSRSPLLAEAVQTLDALFPPQDSDFDFDPDSRSETRAELERTVQVKNPKGLHVLPLSTLADLAEKIQIKTSVKVFLKREGAKDWISRDQFSKSLYQPAIENGERVDVRVEGNAPQEILTQALNWMETILQSPGVLERSDASFGQIFNEIAQYSPRSETRAAVEIGNNLPIWEIAERISGLEIEGEKEYVLEQAFPFTINQKTGMARVFFSILSLGFFIEIPKDNLMAELRRILGMAARIKQHTAGEEMNVSLYVEETPDGASGKVIYHSTPAKAQELKENILRIGAYRSVFYQLSPMLGLQLVHRTPYFSIQWEQEKGWYRIRTEPMTPEDYPKNAQAFSRTVEQTLDGDLSGARAGERVLELFVTWAGEIDRLSLLHDQRIGELASLPKVDRAALSWLTPSLELYKAVHEEFATLSNAWAAEGEKIMPWIQQMKGPEDAETQKLIQELPAIRAAAESLHAKLLELNDLIAFALHELRSEVRTAPADEVAIRKQIAELEKVHTAHLEAFRKIPATEPRSPEETALRQTIQQDMDQLRGLYLQIYPELLWTLREQTLNSKYLVLQSERLREPVLDVKLQTEELLASVKSGKAMMQELEETLQDLVIRHQDIGEKDEAAKRAQELTDLRREIAEIEKEETELQSKLEKVIKELQESDEGLLSAKSLLDRFTNLFLDLHAKILQTRKSQAPRSEARKRIGEEFNGGNVSADAGQASQENRLQRIQAQRNPVLHKTSMLLPSEPPLSVNPKNNKIKGQSNYTARQNHRQGAFGAKDKSGNADRENAQQDLASAFLLSGVQMKHGRQFKGDISNNQILFNYNKYRSEMRTEQDKTILNSKGEAFDEVWARLKLDLPSEIEDPREWLIEEGEQAVADQLARRTIIELAQFFNGLIQGPHPVLDAGNDFLKPAEANRQLLEKFLDTFASDSFGRMAMTHHFRTPLHIIENIKKRLAGATAENDKAKLQADLLQAFAYKAFLRELMKRWRKEGVEHSLEIVDLLGSAPVQLTSTAHSTAAALGLPELARSHVPFLGMQKILVFGGTTTDIEALMRVAPNAQIVNVDIHAGQLQKIQTHFKGRPEAAKLKLYRADATALNSEIFQDESFDFIFGGGLTEAAFSGFSDNETAQRVLALIAKEELRLLKRWGYIYHLYHSPERYFEDAFKAKVLDPIQAAPGLIVKNLSIRSEVRANQESIDYYVTKETTDRFGAVFLDGVRAIEILGAGDQKIFSDIRAGFVNSIYVARNDMEASAMFDNGKLSSEILKRIQSRIQHLLLAVQLIDELLKAQPNKTFQASESLQQVILETGSGSALPKALLNAILQEGVTVKSYHKKWVKLKKILQKVQKEADEIINGLPIFPATRSEMRVSKEDLRAAEFLGHPIEALPSAVLKELPKLRVGSRIRRIRMARGFEDAAQFASAAGITTRTLLDIEKRKMPPQLKSLSKIAQALKIDPVLILEGRKLSEALKGMDVHQKIALHRSRRGWSQTEFVLALEAAAEKEGVRFFVSSDSSDETKRTAVKRWENKKLNSLPLPDKWEIMKKVLRDPHLFNGVQAAEKTTALGKSRRIRELQKMEADELWARVRRIIPAMGMTAVRESATRKQFREVIREAVYLLETLDSREELFKREELALAVAEAFKTAILTHEKRLKLKGLDHHQRVIAALKNRMDLLENKMQLSAPRSEVRSQNLRQKRAVNLARKGARAEVVDLLRDLRLAKPSIDLLLERLQTNPKDERSIKGLKSGVNKIYRQIVIEMNTPDLPPQDRRQPVIDVLGNKISAVRIALFPKVFTREQIADVRALMDKFFNEAANVQVIVREGKFKGIKTYHREGARFDITALRSSRSEVRVAAAGLAPGVKFDEAKITAQVLAALISVYQQGDLEAQLIAQVDILETEAKQALFAANIQPGGMVGVALSVPATEAGVWNEILRGALSALNQKDLEKLFKSGRLPEEFVKGLAERKIPIQPVKLYQRLTREDETQPVIPFALLGDTKAVKNPVFQFLSIQNIDALKNDPDALRWVGKLMMDGLKIMAELSKDETLRTDPAKLREELAKQLLKNYPDRDHVVSLAQNGGASLFGIDALAARAAYQAEISRRIETAA